MFELLAIIAGAACLIIGISQAIMWLIILGIILLAIGGVWVFFFDGDFDFDFFD